MDGCLVSGFGSSIRARAASLPLNTWTLQRFGLTPSRLAHRLSDRGAPRVLSISLPKAGTHLLERAVCLHPRLHRKMLATVWPEALERWHGLSGLLDTLSPGQVIVAHLPFEPDYPAALEAGGVRALFLTRDPRDIVLSQAHYAVQKPDHPFHQAFAGQSDLRGRVRVAIDGDPASGLPSIGDRLERYEGWLHGAAETVRFEDLIGPNGGGDASRQRDVVERIYRHLQLDIDGALVDRVCGELFSDASPTFRKGAIGGWRERFDEELTERFSARVSDERLRAYGYEP
jgi:hypothetical protein